MKMTEKKGFGQAGMTALQHTLGSTQIKWVLWEYSTSNEISNITDKPLYLFHPIGVTRVSSGPW